MTGWHPLMHCALVLQLCQCGKLDRDCRVLYWLVIMKNKFDFAFNYLYVFKLSC